MAVLVSAVVSFQARTPRAGTCYGNDRLVDHRRGAVAEAGLGDSLPITGHARGADGE